ncbi:hypothetical protein DFH11DRAFT_1628021 [Phellopilus nigrolimitatus]|nr:hypothetical protein DFH11DRAFT_1628021 [Phellopilus nigrolimitatus]
MPSRRLQVLRRDVLSRAPGDVSVRSQISYATPSLMVRQHSWPYSRRAVESKREDTVWELGTALPRDPRTSVPLSSACGLVPEGALILVHGYLAAGAHMQANQQGCAPRARLPFSSFRFPNHPRCRLYTAFYLENFLRFDAFKLARLPGWPPAHYAAAWPFLRSEGPVRVYSAAVRGCTPSRHSATRARSSAQTCASPLRSSPRPRSTTRCAHARSTPKGIYGGGKRGGPPRGRRAAASGALVQVRARLPSLTYVLSANPQTKQREKKRGSHCSSIQRSKKRLSGHYARLLCRVISL